MVEDGPLNSIILIDRRCASKVMYSNFHSEKGGKSTQVISVYCNILMLSSVPVELIDSEEFPCVQSKTKLFFRVPEKSF